MGKRWFYRFANLRNKKKKVIRLRLTRKYYKSLYFTLTPKFDNNYYLHFLKFKSMHYYLLRYRQLLQKLMGKISFKQIKKIYTKSNRTKTRMYLFNFLSLLELRLSTTLSNSFILIQVNLVSYLLSRNLLLVNNLSNLSSKAKTHYLDVVSLDVKSIYTSKNNQSPMQLLSLQNKINRFLIVKFFRLKIIKFMYLLKKKTKKNYSLKKNILKTILLTKTKCIIKKKIIYVFLYLIVKGLLNSNNLNEFYFENKFKLLKFYMNLQLLLKVFKILSTFLTTNSLLLHFMILD